MGQQDNVLDGLAWAGFSEEARVAKLAAILVREGSAPVITQARIKEVIRSTSPPYGRAKYIFEALYGSPKSDDDETTGEIQRQYEIYSKRQNEQGEFEAYKHYMAQVSTRLNMAYASAFSRPPYELDRACPIKWSWRDGYDHPNHALHNEWQQQEIKRDKGDECLGITHQDGYVVALVASENTKDCLHIATRLKRGRVTRTYLRDECVNLVEAAVSLGGPKVRAAIAKGKRVKTDWAGRRSFIHHDGSDHEQPKVEEVPWLAQRYTCYEIKDSWGDRVGTRAYNVVVLGERE